MLKVSICSTALFLLYISAFAQPQPPDTLWTRTFGGYDGDFGYSIQQTMDGGYIITGYTYSHGAGSADVCLIKTDANGNEQWTQTFDVSFNDKGYSVQQTSDGGYIITGYTEYCGGDSAGVYLMKTDANGNEQWTQTFDGNDWDEGWSVQQTTDGGYIIAGSTWYYSANSGDVYLIKTDANGNESWMQTFGGSSDEHGYSVQQTSDGGYIIAGHTWSYGSGEYDVFVIKTDTNGNESWTQTFGGSSSDFSYSVQQTTDGGYIIAGKTYSYGTGESDVYLIKTDTNGNEQWTQTFGGSDWDAGHSVQQTSDGGYIIAGYTYSYGAGSGDVYLIKTDANGNEQWTQTFGGGNNDKGRSVQQTSDGGYIIAGYTGSCGAGSYDICLIKTEPDSLLPVMNNDITSVPLSFFLAGACPNPFNPMTKLTYSLRESGAVSLIIYDIQGREIIHLVDSIKPAGLYHTTFDGTNLAGGVYFARMAAAGGFQQTQKLLLVK